MDSFWQAVADHNWKADEKQLEYRVYYNDDGSIKFYSMEDLPGNYLVIDQDLFNQAKYDMRVKDGKLVRVSRQASWKLVPDVDGTACHPNNVSIVVKNYSNPQYWKVKTTYEAD
jgi:hypothetical protein